MPSVLAPVQSALGDADGSKPGDFRPPVLLIYSLVYNSAGFKFRIREVTGRED